MSARLAGGESWDATGSHLNVVNVYFQDSDVMATQQTGNFWNTMPRSLQIEDETKQTQWKPKQQRHSLANNYTQFQLDP
ncbi:hypothetical protein N7520_003885 [Penicillium odoratum]|uniref:uncharacterized protein n=1 Tax=Penicillium odoratum TaxID=1167516 RepID=UPI0025487C26|nr:uncharacterized protein N7520_003885 [Penicillium odoratum]KAJ5769326.1 hypothetical protein N7520_003885 [Penicillium odoratum]